MTLKEKQTTATERLVPRARQETPEPLTWAAFPKEFERTLADMLDKRFVIILLLTILVDFGSIAYFLSTAPEMSESEADRFRKKFAELVRDKGELEREAKFVETPLLNELPPELAPPANTAGGNAGTRRSGGASVAAGGTSAGGSAIAGGSGNVEAGPGAGASTRRTRDEISSAASRAGILGLLTSNSGEASGRAAEDVLGGTNAPQSNLDEALANAGALRRGSSKELGKAIGGGGDVEGTGTGDARQVRGGRSTNAGGIDALVQGLGEGKAQSVQRSGGLEVGANEPLIEEPSEDGKATGSRDRDAVAAVVARHTSAIQFCYQREVKRNPNLRGKIVVRFVITPQGTIASVTVISSNLGNPSVESCIVERIKRWDDFGAIDPSKGNTTFRQVYTFGY